MKSKYLPVCEPRGALPGVMLLPAHRPEAEKRRSCANRRRFMRRRAVVRWLMRTFRLYRRSTL